MPIITPDVSEVKGSIEPGEHRVLISAVDAGEWQSGTPYLKFTLETVDAADPKLNGLKVWHQVPIAGGGAFRFADMFKAAIGESYEAGSSIDTEMFLGRQLAVTVVPGVHYKTGEPTGYPEVKAVRPVS